MSLAQIKADSAREKSCIYAFAIVFIFVKIDFLSGNQTQHIFCQRNNED